MIIRKCIICQKEFQVFPYMIKKGWGRACSRKCSEISRRKPRPDIICKGCGKKFKLLFPHHGYKHCSHECFRSSFANKERLKKLQIGSKRTEQWKREASRRMKGNKYAFGHKPTKEARQKMRDANKGSKSHFWKDGRSYDPEYISWQKQENQHRKRAAEGSYSKEEWQDLRKKCNYTCPNCGRKEPEIKLTVDHIIPLSKGGTNWITNIQCLCLKCNMRKHAKIVNKIPPITRN